MSKVIYEYSVVRYVPDIERGEFVNVGLIMMCKRFRWIRIQLNVDRDRINNCFPGADLTCLENQLKAFDGADIPDPSLPVEERYRWMVAAKSAIIQCSPSHPGIMILPDCERVGETLQSPNCVTAKLDLLFDRLFGRLC